MWEGRLRLRGEDRVLYGEDGRDCEGGRVVWGGRPRLRGEGGLCGEDGRDYEGRKVVWGGRPRLRGEGVLYGEDGRDCEGREGCVGRMAETTRESKVVVGWTVETAREEG